VSNTHVDLTWSVLVADYEHWTTEQRAAAEADKSGTFYSDYAVGLVVKAMQAAGQAVIDANPELFASNELI
jgi:hypothetical protein